MPIVTALRRFILPSLVLTAVAAGVSHAQASSAKPKHPTVCAQGVRVFNDPSQAPTPRDTVEVPPPDAPVRVTSPEQAEAAEMAMRGRAGSVGATGVIVTDQVEENGGERRVFRSLIGIFAPADSAKAQQACKK
ncbi:MAG: hypothetical protein ABI442_14305 [Gemmatimonadaceae bacterium]